MRASSVLVRHLSIAAVSCQLASFQKSSLNHSNLAFQGLDLVGMSELGGVSFFNMAVESPNGDFELLEKVLEGAKVQEGIQRMEGGAEMDNHKTLGLRTILVPSNAQLISPT